MWRQQQMPNLITLSNTKRNIARRKPRIRLIPAHRSSILRLMKRKRYQKANNNKRSKHLTQRNTPKTSTKEGMILSKKPTNTRRRKSSVRRRRSSTRLYRTSSDFCWISICLKRGKSRIWTSMTWFWRWWNCLKESNRKGNNINYNNLHRELRIPHTLDKSKCKLSQNSRHSQKCSLWKNSRL
jgi:hypothetical protein